MSCSRTRWIALLLLAAFAAPLAWAGSEPAIRFVKPRHRATVVGTTEIHLFVDAPDGVSVDRVEVLDSGDPLAILTESPWKLDWNAGDGSGSHALSAIAYMSDGQQARAMVRTSPLTINQIESVDLVNLYLVVRDGGGRYVTDLGRDDFKIQEDGVAQSIDRFATTHKPLRVGIVLDSSLSMAKGERLDRAKQAALSFLDILEAGDEGIVVNFADRVRVTQELTSDKSALAQAISGAVAGGGTALYDAIWKGSKLLEGFDGRRVMVLLSDGRDESANGFEPGSLHTLDEALDQALRSDVMVFSIGLGSNLDKEYVRQWDLSTGLSNLDLETSLGEVLRRLAEHTGGRAVTSTSAGRLRKAFQEIAEDLRNQYSIAYSSTNGDRNGRWREIEVNTPGRTLEIITRKGYYAPKNGGNRRSARSH